MEEAVTWRRHPGWVPGGVCHMYCFACGIHICLSWILIWSYQYCSLLSLNPPHWFTFWSLVQGCLFDGHYLALHCLGVDFPEGNLYWFFTKIIWCWGLNTLLFKVISSFHLNQDIVLPSFCPNANHSKKVLHSLVRRFFSSCVNYVWSGWCLCLYWRQFRAEGLAGFVVGFPLFFCLGIGVVLARLPSPHVPCFETS